MLPKENPGARCLHLLLVGGASSAASFLRNEKGFDVQEARGGNEALMALAEPPPFDLVLSDLSLSDMSGIDLMGRIRAGEAARLEGGSLPGVVIVAPPDGPRQATDAVRSGAFDFLTLPLDAASLPGILHRAAGKNRLFELLARLPAPGNQTTSGAREVALGSLVGLVDWLEEKDTYSDGHCRRVSIYADWLMEGMGMMGDRRRRVALAARVHDLGKLLLGGSWLNCPGPLGEEALLLLREHSESGERALRDVLGDEELDWVRFHHERWDGNGYPDRLPGHKIPFGARVIALADSFDAMTSHRSFRSLRTPNEALAEIESCSGTQFDPSLVPLFLREVGERLAEAGKAGEPVVNISP